MITHVITNVLKQLYLLNKERCDNVVDAVKDMYADSISLFSFVDTSIDHLAYQSHGLAGVCEDLKFQIPEIKSKAWSLKSSISELESALFGMARRKYHREQPSSVHSPNLLNYTVSRNEIGYTINEITHLILEKNKYRRGDMENIRSRIKLSLDDSVEDVIKKAMSLKASELRYKDLPRIDYDTRLCNGLMKDEIVNLYIKSSESLNCASKQFEKRFGMHISLSTLSKYARKYLADRGIIVKNRREAKNMINFKIP